MQAIPQYQQAEDPDAHLTPGQRLKLKKQREADKRAQELKEGASDAKLNHDFANQMKQGRYGAAMYASPSLQQTVHLQQMQQIQPQIQNKIQVGKETTMLS